MINPSDNVLKYKPWSISKANTAKQCPKKFWYAYVNTTKLKKVSNADALVGTTVHKVLEILITGRPWKLALDAALEENTLTHPEIERVMELQSNTEQFIKRLETAQKRYEIVKTISEQKLAINLRGESVEFFKNDDVYLRGIIDLAMLCKVPQAIIIDHKTGKPKDLKWYQDTFDAYALLLKAAYPHLTSVICGIHFVIAGDIPFTPVIDISDSAALMDKLTTFLNNCTQDLDDLTVEKPSTLCAWCDYRVYCQKYTGSDGDNGAEGNQEKT